MIQKVIKRQSHITIVYNKARKGGRIRIIKETKEEYQQKETNSSYHNLTKIYQ